jgi:hypothetical protein
VPVRVALIDEVGDDVALLPVGDGTVPAVGVGGVTGEHAASATPRTTRAIDILMSMLTSRPVPS